MSHELRTPMNAILGFGQLLEFDTQIPLAAEQRENVREILRAGNHLLELINEVLDLARIESGRLELVTEAVSTGQLVKECAAMVQSLANQRKIQLSTHANCQCAVQADRLRLRQVLLNLLSNAIKYNREGGNIDVTCHLLPQERVRVAVRDSGHGIPANALSRLFKPFERAESSHKNIEGTGIGLALAKKLTEAMSGTIGAESVVGEGSTFWVEFPLTTTEAVVQVVASKNLEHGVYPAARTLLYIEDNPANLRLVQKIVTSRKGLAMLDAHSAELGLEIARVRQPDLILLDINLPGMDVHDALHHLQNNPATCHIPVIAVTADAMECDIRKGLDSGFVAYLTKPLQIPAFLALLDKLLEPGKNN
jgi:CheY-like chemotaxis protein/anti-sigma regulatory factor (Ser/Thr protein kinase)